MTDGYLDAEICPCEETTWTELLKNFDDANIHQTWTTGAISCGSKNLDHFVLKKGNEVLAIAQISIREFPFLRTGVATVYWGPLWRRKGSTIDYSIFDKSIEMLKNEYVGKRGFLLRVWPVAFVIPGEETMSILEKHGFKHNATITPFRTLLLDISPPLEDLRKNLAQKWRNQLNTVEKSDVCLIDGCDDKMYETFVTMLHEMLSRKNFDTRIDYARYQRIQSNLPDLLKMKIFICHSKGEPVSGGVFTAIGDTGTYLLGATANNGLKINGSNLIHWAVINWLKEKGCKWYDLGGIDPIQNPGVYKFKQGIAGKSGLDVTHAGQYYLADNALGYALNFAIDFRNRIKHLVGGS